jgi:hypothetical protein
LTEVPPRGREGAWLVALQGRVVHLESRMFTVCFAAPHAGYWCRSAVTATEGKGTADPPAQTKLDDSPNERRVGAISRASRVVGGMLRGSVTMRSVEGKDCLPSRRCERLKAPSSEGRWRGHPGAQGESDAPSCAEPEFQVHRCAAAASAARADG